MSMAADGFAPTRDQESILLGGVIPPMISPLDEQGEPDAAAIHGLVEHILRGGCTGLFVLGGFGEGAWLTTSQRGAVLKAAIAATAGRVPVLAGVMFPEQRRDHIRGQDIKHDDPDDHPGPGRGGAFFLFFCISGHTTAHSMKSHL